MQLFTESLGMLEWLPLFSLCTWSPQLLSVSLSLQDLEGTERLMSQLLQDPTLLTVAGAAGYSAKMLL